ncbi:MAG: hypothetical protein JST38_06770 [Bacteroidetes bacterium]|nr:hypothetical protein [Bacteroidota bacterium]HRN37298.1 hypothetical protein [Flavobacteriales bacterium]
MTQVEKRIIEAYTGLWGHLKPKSKFALLERLVAALKHDEKPADAEFFSTFGAFSSSRSPESIIEEIKGERKFRSKELGL